MPSSCPGMAIFAVWVLSNILVTSCLGVNLIDVEFISGVSNNFKFDSVVVIVPDINTINHQTRDALYKSVHTKFSIVEVSDADQIIDIASDEADVGGCFLYHEDRSELLRYIDTHGRKSFKTKSWFIMLQNTGEEAHDLGVMFSYDSDVFLVMEKPNRKDILEVYSLKEEIIQAYVGSWSRTYGLDIKKPNKWERRRNLRGISFKAVYLPELGNLDIKEGATIDSRNLAGVPWVGYVPDMFQSLARSMNFTFKLAESRDGRWGIIDDSGHWNGIVKDLMEEEADISACTLFATTSRSAVVDFGLHFRSEYTTFYISKQSSSFSIDIFTKPFTSKVWLVLFIIIIGTSLIFTSITKYGKEMRYAEFSLHKCCIYVYGAFGGFAARRWSVTPVNFSARYQHLNSSLYCLYIFISRIVFITVLVCGCLNHWHWKASIISHLSIVVPSATFKSLEEFLESSYQITTLKDSYFSKFWSESEEGGLMKTISEKKFMNEEASLKTTEQEAITQTMTGKYAFFGMESGTKHHIEYKQCKIKDVGFRVSKSDSALAFPKTSPYRDVFNYAIRKMTESGEIRRIAMKYKPEERSCGGGEKGRTLGFENIILVFIIFGFGLFLSIISLLLELAARTKMH